MIHMKKKIYLFVFFLQVSVVASFAQSGNTDKKTQRKILRNEREADIYFSNTDYQSALDLYRQGYKFDTTNAQVTFKIATCMYHLKKYKQESLPYFEKALHGGISAANYYLGNLYHLNGKFDEAINSFEEYKKKFGKKIFSDEEVDFLISKCKTAKE